MLTSAPRRSVGLGLLWLLLSAGCAKGAGDEDQPIPAADPAPPHGSTGTTFADSALDDALSTTPQLRNAVHDLARLHLITAIRQVTTGRLVLTLDDEALAPGTALAYELEHLYAAYRSAYQLGDVVVLELWHNRRQVGQYTGDGLLMRSR